jgi:hypothetical protein
MILHQAIKITGLPNDTAYDKGLTSTEKIPKRLISVMAQVTEYGDNYFEGWIEKLKVTEIPDSLLDTLAFGGATLAPVSAQRINEIPAAVDLAVGQTYKAAMRCGATPFDFVGCYVYEVKE